jgi:hypothetical protein
VESTVEQSTCFFLAVKVSSGLTLAILDLMKNTFSPNIVGTRT